MATNKKKDKIGKERTTLDKVTDAFIVCVVLAGIFFIASIVVQGYKEKQATKRIEEKSGNLETQETAASSTPLPDGVVRYNNSISSGEQNDTEFYLLFDYNDNTYTEMVRASSLEDALDEGSFEDKEDVITIKSSKNKNYTETFHKDGEYLVPESGLFKGEIGEGETFEVACVQESKDYTTTINFYKGGTYSEEKSSKTEGVQDSARGGTYERKDGFISRTSMSGEDLLDLYIYNGSLTNAYYKLSE